MFAFHEAEPQWHEGEEQMHKLLRVPSHYNPTSPFLTPQASHTLARSPLLALGTLDEEGRPWTTLWVGETGFSRPIGESIIGVATTVDRLNDPVVKVLLGERADGEVIKAEGGGKMLGGLTFNLQTRQRVKLYGRMVAGAVAATEEGVGEVQLAVKIEQSLGNCPKYMNKKQIRPHVPKPKLELSNFPLSQSAVDLVNQADMFFISSSNHDLDMDTNHRGGPPGFVRILSNDENGLVMVYPEYSGNRLYQTLGNLITTPKAGLVFPNFDTGDVLYVTGRTEIVTGKEASNLISHTNLAVKIQMDALRYVTDGLGFRGKTGQLSPYNPPVRYLSVENRNELKHSGKQTHAKLIEKRIITPTIARFKFRITDPDEASQWKPGQYVALGFENELDMGYSHMRDDDPKSLNDDWLRTFTVSSRHGGLAKSDQFEITIRKVGAVTEHLFRSNVKSDLEVPLLGFGGEFYFQQNADENISFIAGGIGITPLLAQAADLDLNRLKLYWNLRADDLSLAVDTFDNIAGLAEATTLFVTGNINLRSKEWKKVTGFGATIKQGRMTSDAISGDSATKWYICTGTGFKNTLLGWLKGKTVLFEDFNY